MTSIFKFLKSRLQGNIRRKLTSPRESEPSSEEWDQAKETLEELASPACFGELGGFRPRDSSDRFSSWWGGNFLARTGEAVPNCEVSGNAMLPILQIRTDELPHVPGVFAGIALLTLWYDPETEFVWESKNHRGFAIRTYSSLDDLVPIGPGYKEHETMPTFPIKWHKIENDLPDWETTVDFIPPAVARSGDSDWFHSHPGQDARAQLQTKMPIKVGGHSQWWQSPQNVENGEFALFLDSTPKGNFGFPAGGNANFFRTNETWEVRVDCT